MESKKNPLRFRNNKEVNTYNSQKFRKFREENADKVHDVIIESINLINPIHTNANVRLDKDIEYYISHGKKADTPLIVKRLGDGKGFELISGWKYYHLAKALGQEFVNIIEVETDSRVEFMKSIGCYAPFKVCKMADLNVPEQFDMVGVKTEKLEAIKTYEYKYHAPLKPIIIDENMLILDGYAQYVYNRNMEKDYCEVRIVRK